MGASKNSNENVGVGIDCDSFQRDMKRGDFSSNNSSAVSISSSSSFSSDDNDGIKSSSTSIHHDNIVDGKSKDLWWIHGHGYDLMNFVKDHPGGTEAILLGKGRDCTALVESYHAFSGERVWKILEKHRFVEEEREEIDEFATVSATTVASTEERSGRVPDFFYEVLKKRVTKVLHSKGIDPVKDRGASRIRIAYYLAVLGSWLYAGYLHCSVSLSFHLVILLYRICFIQFFHGVKRKSKSLYLLFTFQTRTTKMSIGKHIGFFRVRCHWMVDGCIRA